MNEAGRASRGASPAPTWTPKAVVKFSGRSSVAQPSRALIRKGFLRPIASMQLDEIANGSHLALTNALDAIAFYKKAFGAELKSHAPGTTPGSTMHAEIRVGDSSVFLADMFGPGPVQPPSSTGGATCMIHLFVPNADATFAAAVGAGAKVVMPLTDMFWGDRYGLRLATYGRSQPTWRTSPPRRSTSARRLSSRR